jgi:hypothetical protein
MKQFSAKRCCIFVTLHGVQTHKLRYSPGFTTAGRLWPGGDNTLDVLDNKLQIHAQWIGAVLFVRPALSNNLLFCLRLAVRAHLNFLLTASPVPQNCTYVRNIQVSCCSQLSGCVCACSEFWSCYGYYRMRNCVIGTGQLVLLG